MSRDFKLRICSLNWKSSDTTRHDTGLGTGLSLARGSGYCFDFPAAFLFDGMTDFVKGCRDNDIGKLSPQAGYSNIFIRRLWLIWGVQNFEF